MSDDGIWLVRGDGGLVPMEPSKPASEDDLQSLIARHCEVIAGDGEKLLLVRREQGIADSEEGGERWSLDHLFVTRDAIPVLVEVKRASDTRIRREVVAQMLDYAANGAARWSAGAAAQSFAATCLKEGVDPEERLAEFLGPESDTEGFWERMDQNLRSGRLKMLFVADRIPDELATIVEFLNEHTRDHIEVRAVELRHFEGGDGLLTLVRRVVGETAQVKLRKRHSGELPPVTVEEWLDREIGAEGTPERDGAEVWLSLMAELGAETGVTSRQGSIYARVATVDGKEAYPLYLEDTGRANICFRYNHSRGRLANEELRRSVLNRFSDAVDPLSTDNLKGWPAFSIERLTDPDTAARFREVARSWLDLCRDPSEPKI